MTNQQILEKAIAKAIEGGYPNESAVRPVVGYENRYWVDADGVVIGKRGVIIQYLDRKGYFRVTLNKKVDTAWKSQLCQVHRLIAKAFIPNPHNKPQVNHKNGKRADNKLHNLEWVTAQENVQDGFNRGRVTWNKYMKSVNTMTLEDLARQLPRLQAESKALWGDEDTTRFTDHNGTRMLKQYELHLIDMVIDDDPIKYLGDNI